MKGMWRLAVPVLIFISNAIQAQDCDIIAKAGISVDQ
jgi:hypothetical protein